MASDKKLRKGAKAAKKQQAPQPGPFRHTDGDRRRKDSGPAYRDAMVQKESLRHVGAVDLPEDDEDEWDEESA